MMPKQFLLTYSLTVANMTNRLPLPLVGQLNEHVSQDINYQRLINLVPFKSGFGGRGNIISEKGPTFALLPTPGLSELIDLSGNEVREIIEFNDKVYAIVDDTVYKLTINTTTLTATSQSLGTIGTFTGRVSWDANRSSKEVMLVTGDFEDSTEGWLIDTENDVLTQITDADFNGGITVRQIDSYFVVNTPNSDRLQSTSSNDGSSVNALDFASAEAAPDKTVAVERDKGDLWVFGENSSEVWYNDGGTGFPFARRGGAVLDIGCAAAFSIQKIQNTMIWLSSEREIVRAQGYSPETISSEFLNKEIQSYETVSNAFSYTYYDRGSLFYAITFPNVQKTWVCDLKTGLWHQQAFWTENASFTRSKVNCCLRYKNLNLVGDFETGKIYIYGDNYLDDNGQEIHRIVTLPFQHSQFNQIEISRLELHVEVGKASITGSYTEPMLMMRHSEDGGYTWSNERTGSLGKTGEYSKRIFWTRVGTKREWLFELSISDPVKFSIIDATIDISGGYKA